MSYDELTLIDKKIKTCSNGLPLYNMYSSLMITKSPTFTTLVSIVLCITHVLILVLLILWLYITFVITPSKPLDYPVTLSINNTLRWGVALVNPVDVTISSFTYFILPNINVFIVKLQYIGISYNYLPGSIMESVTSLVCNFIVKLQYIVE